MSDDEEPVREPVPDGDVEVTMLCPVCPGAVDCEMIGPDGWRCLVCQRTWDLDGTGGEMPDLRCAGCDALYNEQEMPPPTCRVSGGYCTPVR